MKFDCGEPQSEKESRLGTWHSWFAWYPVRVGERDCRWLELIYRRGVYDKSYAELGWLWEYRAYER